ncbi:zinc-binding oxidoreductase [Aspergillus campestris IBT 28561]|uniref:Zinc-binding oxidoreductase n=1 Tax=Aspergillus campestris (strain IBT 28561) TaxID=1392248 RepID=A0A2I1D2P8_ASPC2|nr:zinc-binding oxidoreductase [Aspergillus campestris IBT 28561]PKY04147.1 zinc-binding oxidoreductase [Aspergillus campestris IBT 28561]
MDELTFVPPTMRALYFRPASTAITDTTDLDLPRQDSDLVYDTDFMTPQPAANQYLVKVLTAAFSHDELRLSKLLNPSKSYPQIPLHNFCGTVIRTPPQDDYLPSGPKFKVGDVVFGMISHTHDGAAADYVVVSSSEIALKPKNISSAEAASIPRPALTAWQSLFKYAALDPDNSHTRHRLRVLVTNASDSEVASQAIQLLRSPSLFPTDDTTHHHHRPWICATCSSSSDQARLVRTHVDEIIHAPLPLPEEFNLADIFKSRGWAPVDIVLDCAGQQIFRQAHSPSVIKDNGVVLTAVDSDAAGDMPSADSARFSKKGILSRFVTVVPDGEALGRIAELVEKHELRGRVESTIDLVQGADILSAGAAGAGGALRGGVYVFRVNVQVS